jgi:hypothetical protein
MVLIQNTIEKSPFRKFVFETHYPELFIFLKEIVISGEYKIHSDKYSSSTSLKDNYVYTRFVCDFKPGTVNWIQNIVKINTYNDIYNII